MGGIGVEGFLVFMFIYTSIFMDRFIYAFMGIGILVCCITCIGHIGAEAINGCCLCFVSFSPSLSSFSYLSGSMHGQLRNCFVLFVIVIFAGMCNFDNDDSA